MSINNVYLNELNNKQVNYMIQLDFTRKKGETELQYIKRILKYDRNVINLNKKLYVYRNV